MATTTAPYGYGAWDPVNVTDPSGECVTLFGATCLGGGSVTGLGDAVVNGFDTARHAVASATDTVVNSAAYTWFNQHLNPAYFALMGYYNEWQASENGCALSTVAKYGAQGVLGVVSTGLAASGIEEAGSAVLGTVGFGATEVMTGPAVEEAITALPRGSGEDVFTVSSTSDLDQLFAKLSKGGSPVDSTYPGEMVELPDGTRVGLRPSSTSGGPTIDANISDGSTLKVHVTPWPPVG